MSVLNRKVSLFETPEAETIKFAQIAKYNFLRTSIEQSFIFITLIKSGLKIKKN